MSKKSRVQLVKHLLNKKDQEEQLSDQRIFFPYNMAEKAAVHN
jgi:hypothetical protein